MQQKMNHYDHDHHDRQHAKVKVLTFKSKVANKLNRLPHNDHLTSSHTSSLFILLAEFFLLHTIYLLNIIMKAHPSFCRDQWVTIQ